MSTPLPPSSESENPDQLPPIPDALRALYAVRIEHNRFQNTIVFKDTKLLEFVLAAPVVQPNFSPLHQKSWTKLREIIRKDGGVKRLSRTNHSQLAALVERYYPEQTIALTEANHLERIAAEMTQAVSQERSRGNVHFVRAKAKP